MQEKYVKSDSIFFSCQSKSTTSPFVRTVCALSSSNFTQTTNRSRITWIFSSFRLESLNRWVGISLINCTLIHKPVFQTTNKDKTVSFDCQHGPAECDGNRVQSCVLNHLANDADAQAEFVNCQMKFSAEPSGAKVSEMEECHTNKELHFASPLAVCWSCGCSRQRNHRVLWWCSRNSAPIGSWAVDQGHFPVIRSDDCLQLGENCVDDNCLCLRARLQHRFRSVSRNSTRSSRTAHWRTF